MLSSRTSRLASGKFAAPPAKLALAASEQKLQEAISAILAVAPLSANVKINVLRRIGETVPTDPADVDAAFARVKLRSIGVEDEIRTMEGGGVADAGLAASLGLGSRETVRSYREKGKIFAWQKDARNLRYPAWQVHEGSLLPGLAEVLAVFAQRDMAPLAIADYFLSESDELDGRRPLDLLREKRVQEVLDHAARHGDIGA